MGGWTNRGKAYVLRLWARNVPAVSSTFYLVLVKSTPDPDDNSMSDLTEIAAGNGYTSGGQAVGRNLTDFDVWTEDDTNDKAYVQMKDFGWTASGGPLPSDSAGATYAVITDDVGPVASRYVFHYNGLVEPRVVSDGESLTLQNIEIDIFE